MSGRLYIVKDIEVRELLENDVIDLRDTFETFGTVVEEIDVSEIHRQNFYKKLATSDFSDHSFVAVAVLAHGNDNDRAEIMGKTVEIQKSFLIPMCSNKTLNEKLKLLILQTCRGPFDFLKETPEGPPKSMYPKYYAKLFATSEGCKSYPSSNRRSIFIERLCNQIRSSYKDTDLMSIMEKTSNEVKEITQANSDIVLIPCCESNLGDMKFCFPK